MWLTSNLIIDWYYHYSTISNFCLFAIAQENAPSCLFVLTLHQNFCVWYMYSCIRRMGSTPIECVFYFINKFLNVLYPLWFMSKSCRLSILVLLRGLWTQLYILVLLSGYVGIKDNSSNIGKFNYCSMKVKLLSKSDLIIVKFL